MQVLETITYKTFQEFFGDVLSPSGSMYGKIKDFIYRGEASNTFELIPSVLRKDNAELIRNLGGYTDANGNEYEELQIKNEITLIRDFYKKANKNGLKVPNITAIDNAPLNVFEDVMHSSIQAPFQWIHPEYKEIAALAQHYGVPTRLLDWTSDIFVAIYFATIGTFKRIKSGEIKEKETIVIWSLNAEHIQYLENTTEATKLKFIVPKYSDNPNLNAQKGVLSYWEIIFEPNVYIIRKHINETGTPYPFGVFPMKPIDRMPLNELLDKQFQDKEENSVPNILYKFEIPILEAIPAFEYINKIGYTAGRLSPGYAGIKKEMEEYMLFVRTKESLKK